VLTSFGPGSEVEPAALLIRRDGKLVVAGDFTSPSGPAAVALAGYKRDGTLDRSFGRGGRVASKLYEYAFEGARAAVLQGNGKVVVNTDDGLDSVLARYTVEGKLDSGFGHGGRRSRATTTAYFRCLRSSEATNSSSPAQ
jgi:hypothetical protein